MTTLASLDMAEWPTLNCCFVENFLNWSWTWFSMDK